MALAKKTLDKLRISPGETFRVADHDPDWIPPLLRKMSKKKRKKAGSKLLKASKAELAAAQELLYASDKQSLLLVFQAMDAAGKDGTIKHVMSGVNPQGCEVHSFKAPSSEELSHNFLWRYSKALPERGRIGIFNRSYFEEVLILKVHPEILARQGLPDGLLALAGKKSFWRQRYEDINAFEEHLTRNGTVILKFFLNVSFDEQRERFLERAEDPAKHWKFSPNDLTERAYWSDYMRAFEDALNATSTQYAPWYVIPADHKWAMRAAVADIVSTTISGMGLAFPQVSDEQLAVIQAARTQLAEET